MKKISFIICACFLASLIFSCSSAPGEKESAGERTLEKTKWMLTKGEEMEIGISGGQKPAYIEFESETKRIFGNLGCNSFTGQYEIDADNSLFIKGIASTKMMCADMKTEDALKRILQKTRSLRITGNKLYLLEYEKVIGEFRGM